MNFWALTSTPRHPGLRRPNGRAGLEDVDREATLTDVGRVDEMARSFFEASKLRRQFQPKGRVLREFQYFLERPDFG